MGALPHPDLDVNVEVRNTLHNHLIDLGLRLRAQHRCELQSEPLVHEQAYNLRPVFVREALYQLVQNLLLESWIRLSYLLQVRWQLPNDRILVNLANLGLNLVLVVLHQAIYALLDGNRILYFEFTLSVVLLLQEEIRPLVLCEANEKFDALLVFKNILY